MQDIAGKTAFITGGASGIGLALGREFAAAGVNVMLADIEPQALAAAVASLSGRGPEVRGTVCDVADAASMDRAAQETFASFGKVHILCNNAGVGGGTGINDIQLETWRWVIDVNLMGVVHGIRSFLPHIQAHGEGGHIVNTASLAGLQSGIGFGPYVASKFAVVGISEGLAVRLQPLGIGVTILCPGFVRTRIGESVRNRPARYGAAPMPDPESPAGLLAAEIARLVEAGIDPSDVAARTLAAIRMNKLYAFTHPEMHAEVEERFATITQAMRHTK